MAFCDAQHLHGFGPCETKVEIISTLDSIPNLYYYTPKFQKSTYFFEIFFIFSDA